MTEVLVALNITDNQLYNRYREEMTPILKSYGGGFSYDFEIASVLVAKTEAPINRVFTIFFPDEDSKARFFENDKYLKIKEKYYKVSVTNTTVISTYIV